MTLPLAVQLYTFRDPARFGGAGMGLDVPTLSQIAAAGFLGVETVDVPGGDPAAARQVLADLDLAIASCHTWADVADPDAVARAAEALAELGLDADDRVQRAGHDAWPRSTRWPTGWPRPREVAAGHGLRFGYHNHDAELHAARRDARAGSAGRVGSATPSTSRSTSSGSRSAGPMPAAVVERLGERVVSLHVKDGVELPTTRLRRRAVRQRAGRSRARRPGAGHRRGRGGSRRSSGSSSSSTTSTGRRSTPARRSHDHLVERGLARGRGS